jgi:hypothetical protein
MPGIPLRFYFYLGALAAISIWLVWWHHSAVLEGEAMIKAADAAAVIKSNAAREEQRLKDAANAQGAIDGLKTELDALRAATPPVVHVRLCQFATLGGNSVPSTGSAPGGAPAEAPAPANLQSVPERTGDGPDVGAGLQDLAFSCGIVEVYRKRTVTWALNQAKETP